MKRNAFILFTILLTAVTLFSCRTRNSSLPEVSITADSLSWEHKQPCLILLNNEENVKLPARIKFRGGMSSKYNKHSFALELDEKHSLAGFPSDDDYILNANYIDKTFMRHKISYDLFREMNPQRNLAAQSAYVTLHLNGNYEGIYVLMQKVTAKMLGLNKTDPHAVLFKDPPIFRDSLPTDTGNCFGQKFPKWKTEQRTKDLIAFRQFLLTADNFTFAHNITKWVDLNNVVDWHLLLLFTNNEDGIVKNFYLYKTCEEAPFRIAIWDYDHSFGRDCDGEYNMLERTVDIRKNLLLRRLWNMPEYQAKVKARWHELRKNGLISEKKIKKMVEVNDQQIHCEVAKNFERWPANAPNYYDDASYQEEVDLLLEFVHLRLKQLDKILK